MITDFFIGKRNKKIEAWALNLGFKKILFVKQVSSMRDLEEIIHDIKNNKKSKINKSNFYDILLIVNFEPQILRKMIDKSANYFKIIFVLGTNDKINRIALEHKKVSALISPEYERKKDYVHYRNSGLNQVLCKIARDNNKFIFINFNDVLLSKGREKALILGRIMQNIKLCKKYNVKLRIANFSSDITKMRSYSDLRSFCFAIGMTNKETKESFLF